MHLLEILKTNGTGLLQGLCRPKEYDSFPEIPKLLTGNQNTDPANIQFSLNEKYLGECEVKFTALHSDDLGAVAISTDEKISFDFTWENDCSDHCYFKATLSQSNRN
ncbi:MAG: hypothetical protein WCO58_00555 [bacterium]